MKLRLLIRYPKNGGLVCIIQVSPIITRILKSRRGRQKRKSEGYNVRRTQPFVAGFEDGRRGHEPRTSGRSAFGS